MTEIEIEKKFLPSEDQLKRLLEGATEGGERVNTDTYYDTAMYALGMKDWWLRKRNEGYELKISLNAHGHVMTNRYREVTDEIEIRRELGLSEEEEMDTALAAQGIMPFGTWTTHRHAYTKDGFTIDVDEVDFGTFKHHVVEIELIVSDASLAEEASDRILAFARGYGLSTEPIAGKATTYLKRERPEHYAALEKVWSAKV